MKTALVISGGGCKGAFAVGVLKRLKDLHRCFDIIVGTSTGALLTPLAAAGCIALAEHIYSSVRTKDLLRKHCWITLPWRAGLYKHNGLWNIIQNNYTLALHTQLSCSDVIAEVCTANLNSGRPCYWRAGSRGGRDEFMRALLASSNEPGFMAPIEVVEGTGEYHLDGGIMEIAPIQRAVDLGATEVLAIVLDAEHPRATRQRYNRIPGILCRTLDLMTTEIRNNDTRVRAKLTVIRPKEQLTDNSLRFDPEEMREMIQKGYSRAMQVIG
jgi:predicted acylesterase/phospholipase RssA